MHINDLETPVVLIDQDILDRNLRGMADYCASHRIALRPHTKTHKIPEIGRLQVQYGSAGITVAKVSEAEVMADAGISDIVVVYPVWEKANGDAWPSWPSASGSQSRWIPCSWRKAFRERQRRRVSRSEFDWNSIRACAGAGCPSKPRRSR